VRLWRAGVAPVLVISDGRAEGWETANRLCGEPRVVCFVPDPYSTQGEARWLGREARRRGWAAVVVVTSTYHLRRARWVVERCYAGRLAAVAAEPPLANWAIGIAWEWPKGLYYLTRKRGC
jgi:uncharacterized SAM-binding protein YcdF (DUF218 family)